jgi:ABC-type transporter Mla subunit MlaD
MGNEVLIVVRSEDRTDPGFNAARAKGKKLGADLEADAKASSKKMGQAYGEGIGSGLNMAASDAAPKLSAKLVPAAEKAGKEAGEKLGEALGDTLAPAVIPGAHKAGKAAGDELGDGIVKGADGRLRDAKGKFVATGMDLGAALGKGAAKSGSESLLASAPQWAAPAAAIGLAMAPMLGGALAAAVVGAGGLTGIAGGLLVASKDPAVKAAGESLKDQIGGDLKKAATDFVPAAVDGIGQVRAAWQSILPDVKAIFSGSSTLLGPFLDGVIDGTKGIVRGIRAAVEQGEPVIESLGRLFANVGDSVGRMFEGFADNADESASALDDLTDALVNTLDATAGLINGLTEIHGGLDTVDEAIDEERYRWERLIPFLDATADGYEKNSTAAELYRQGIIGAAGATNDYSAYVSKQREATEKATGAIDDQTSALQALADEMKAQTDPLFALIDGQSKVAEAQTAHNKAVEKFGKNSPEAREAMTKLGKAAFDLADKAGDAASGFNGKLTPAMRTALRNAGLTAPQINKLEQELKQAAAAARRWEGTFTQTYETRFKQFGKPYSEDGIKRGQVGGLAHGGIKGAASGMVASGMTWVGETGPELINLPPGAAVRSAGDSARALSQDRHGQGNNMPVTIFVQVDGQTIARATLPSLQKINRTEYSGDVTRMFPATR